MKEIWKDVVGYEGCYEVSNMGGLRRLEFFDKDKVILPLVSDFVYYPWGDYRQVGLIKNGKRKTITLHKLVAQAFIPNPCNKPLINHKNRIRQDNRVENLEWVTQSENMYHAKGNKNYINQTDLQRLDYVY